MIGLVAAARGLVRAARQQAAIAVHSLGARIADKIHRLERFVDVRFVALGRAIYDFSEESEATPLDPVDEPETACRGADECPCSNPRCAWCSEDDWCCGSPPCGCHGETAVVVGDA